MEDKQKIINVAKNYPNLVDQSTSKENPQITAPMAMAELEILKAEGKISVADKNPELRNVALLLAIVIGVTLFSQISSYLIIESFNNTQSSFFSVFVGSNGVFGITLLLIQVIAVFALLFTRNTSHAKTIILIAGIGFGITLVKGIFSFGVSPTMMFSFASLVVNFLIFQKIFKVYLEL